LTLGIQKRQARFQGSLIAGPNDGRRRMQKERRWIENIFVNPRKRVSPGPWLPESVVSTTISGPHLSIVSLGILHFPSALVFSSSSFLPAELLPQCYGESRRRRLSSTFRSSLLRGPGHKKFASSSSF
jgi:hypothetical protein